MEILCEKETKIEDGVHNGVISDVSYRTEPYKYTDLTITMADGKKCTVGYPTMIMKQSKLGQLLTRMNVLLTEGTNYDPEKLLVNQKVSFQTTTEIKGDKKYTKVLTESVKPIQPVYGEGQQ